VSDITEMVGHITEAVSDTTEMVGHITEVVSDITEMVGHITEIVGESTEIRPILITSSRRSFSVNQQLQASVHWILRK
jgi:methyl-accepting chemotaxis protein